MTSRKGLLIAHWPLVLNAPRSVYKYTNYQSIKQINPQLVYSYLYFIISLIFFSSASVSLA